MEAMEKPEMECRQILTKGKWEDDKYDSIYDSDVMPKYPNILFIEGIAGGGKSTLLKLITKFYLIRIRKQILKEIN